MNTKRLALSAVVSFIFIFGFEWVWHGMLLMDDYEATSQLWRPMESHEQYFHFMVLSQLAQAFLLAFIFTRAYEGKGIGEGLRFGLYIGLLLAALDFGSYCYLPVPFMLILSWMGGTLIKCVGVGAILALVYRR